MVCDQGVKVVQWGKESFQQIVPGYWIVICKKAQKTNQKTPQNSIYLIPHKKVNLKWITDKNGSAKPQNFQK